MRVEEVDPDATYDLRRRVLLAPPRPVELEGDDRPATFHLAAFDGDRIVGVVTLVPTDRGHQLRGMAVDPACQGTGVGRVLVEAAVERLRAAGEQRVWCNARDTAIPFYERLGFRISGDGFLHAPSGLPHHPMELVLQR
jgi:predicted N-acetyltransferase YhbS